MNTQKIFLESFFSCFLFFILFFSQPGFVYAVNTTFVSSTPNLVANFAESESLSGLTDSEPLNLGSNSTQVPNPQTPSLTTLTPTLDSSFDPTTNTCTVSTLSPEEAKQIMNLTHDGFDGNKISDGKIFGDTNTSDANKDNVKDLGKNELIGRDSFDEDLAVKVDAPSIAAPANRFSFLNGLAISGPFGIGLIFDDTLRVGKCDFPAEQQYLCKIFGEENLSTRTSGVGFQENFVNAFSSIGGDSKNSLVESALGKSDADKLKENYLDIDSNDFITGSFGKGKMLGNILEVSSYEAKNSTTCNNSSCVVSTYSAFNKYFNFWLTTDMVVYNMAPTFLMSSYKVLTKIGKVTGFSNFNFAQNIRQKYLDLTSPYSLFGKKRAELFKTLMNEEGMSELLEQPLVIEMAAWRSGAGGETAKLLAMNSPIWKLSPEKRTKYMQAVELLRAYSKESDASIKTATDIYNGVIQNASAIPDQVLRDAMLNSAKIDYAQKVAGVMDDWDEVLALDFEAWLKGNEDVFAMGSFAVKQNGLPDGQGFNDIATSPSAITLKKIVQTFRNDGDFSAWANSETAGTFKTAADGVSLQLYSIKPENVIAQNVSLADLRLHLAKMGSGAYSVQVPNGDYLPLSEASIKYIESNPLLAGHINVYSSKYVEDIALTPSEFATRLTHGRILGRPATAVRNLDDLHNGLIQNNFAPRKYASELDYILSQEKDIITNYFKNPSTAAKITFYPIIYWGAKKGFGQKDFSAFMLPETWTTMKANQGVDEIYRDSFIDFFVNEGSDQGDMFKRAFTMIPFAWTQIIGLAVANNEFIKENLAKYSGGWFEGSVTRDKVGDVAFYFHNENCTDCTGKIDYANDHLALSMYSGLATQAFLLEATSEEQKSKTGSLLVSFTHHSNISGESSGESGEPINISSARREGITCDQKLREMGFGWAGSSSAFVVGSIQHGVTYFFGIGPGLIASLVQQMKFGRELQDCVDDVEGYYIHFYSPPIKEQEKSKSKEIISNEKISETLSNFSSKIDEVVSNKTDENTSPANPVQKSLDSLSTQFQDFSEKSKQTSILQAKLELDPPIRGKIIGSDVFYIWFKDTLMPNAYNTGGKLVTTDGNNSVEVNFESGELKINNKVVLGKDKEDHTRLIALDNRVPAQVVPMTLTRVSAPNSLDTVFEVDNFGRVRVLESSVLDCIQKAIQSQSGITYSGDELTQVFGKIKQFSTDLYTKIIPIGGKITLEGNGPRLMGGGGSKVLVNGYWDTNFFIDSNNNASTGKFVGFTFEYGSIILKPQTNELIIWLRQHADAVLNNDDVKGLNANLTQTTDPLSDCPVPAIDLEAVSFPNDELGAKKVDSFNTSMDHLGPFTQFTTDKRVYEFYAKRDESGECKDYFRVRDKDSGQILVDEEIAGAITQDADGTIRFNTVDGREHSLDFNAENGVPKVVYNGGAPETIFSAQGQKGSFWYDPSTGQWYPENGLQIPLNQAFKDNGTWFGTDKNGNLTGVPENKMTFNIGQQSASPLSLPSVPENIFSLILFVSLFLLIGFSLTRGRNKIGFTSFKRRK